MFASKTLTEHLLRGTIGGASACAAVYFSEVGPWVPLVLLPVALLAFRGCPMCWLTGLAETVAATVQRRPRRDGCLTGSCER